MIKNGAPGEIRTPDLQLRRLPLYPAELRAHYDSPSVHRESGGLNGPTRKISLGLQPSSSPLTSAFNLGHRSLAHVRLQDLLAESE
jgi:hypothetical protein